MAVAEWKRKKKGIAMHCTEMKECMWHNVKRKEKHRDSVAVIS